MKSKKLIGILLSAALVFSVAMPTVLAAAADSDTDNTVEETSAVSESMEEPASSQEEQEPEASSGGTDTPADSGSDEKKDDLPDSTGSTSNDPDGDFDDPDDDFGDLDGDFDEEPFEHWGDCSDECELDDPLCPCPCHLAKKLVENILACLTLDAVDAFMEATPDYVFEALSNKQFDQIDEHIAELVREEIARASGEVDFQEDEPDLTTPSEVVYVTVNVTDVAPFGDPVVGGRD